MITMYFEQYNFPSKDGSTGELFVVLVEFLRGHLRHLLLSVEVTHQADLLINVCVISIDLSVDTILSSSPSIKCSIDDGELNGIELWQFLFPTVRVGDEIVEIIAG